jgi:uncharacterized membrane protein
MNFSEHVITQVRQPPAQIGPDRLPASATGTALTNAEGRSAASHGGIHRDREAVSMSQIQQSIDVEVPVRTAYNQWTQFESFPEFMSGVESITQLDDKRLHWVTSIAGVEREFDAEITEQHPDERVAWASTGGESKHAGVVTFHKLDDNLSRVMVQIDWTPTDLVEKIGSAVNIDDHRVKGDLERFKEFIESRGHETGAWRGDVDNDA